MWQRKQNNLKETPSDKGAKNSFTGLPHLQVNQNLKWKKIHCAPIPSLIHKSLQCQPHIPVVPCTLCREGFYHCQIHIAGTCDRKQTMKIKVENFTTINTGLTMNNLGQEWQVRARKFVQRLWTNFQAHTCHSYKIWVFNGHMKDIWNHNFSTDTVTNDWQ